MNDTSDALDILVSIVAMLLVMAVCIWSLDSIRDDYTVSLAERAVVHNVYSDMYETPEPEFTMKDALLILVVNDTYLPAPTEVRFNRGAGSYTITFDSAFLKDREQSLNTAWDEFFQYNIDHPIEGITLMRDEVGGDRWDFEIGG